MYIEPPATIAILGAGPIGLEAGLYGRYLGYNVQIFEEGEVAANVLRWGHVKMFSPFEMNSSALALGALAAQDESYEPPSPQASLTGKEWAEQYLLPLANSDLLGDCLRTQTQVISVSRHYLRKGERIGEPSRAESPFRLLVKDAAGEREEFAEVVIDATGTYGSHNHLGSGGGPAVGEVACQDRIEYGLPDISGQAKARYAGRRILVVGSGYSAATNVVALAELAHETGGELTWFTKSRSDEWPIAHIHNDRLKGRDGLAKRANGLVRDGSIHHLQGATISKIAFDEQDSLFKIEFEHQEEKAQAEFDEVIANVGYRPNAALYGELQVHECYATGGPMKLSAALMGETSGDCLDQTGHGADALRTPEINFYILGSKSYGRGSDFLVSVGLQQVKDVFSIIGDRSDLDLYSSMAIPK